MIWDLCDMPVPGIPFVVLIPRLLKFIEFPRPPSVKLAPDFEKFTLAPLHILTDFLNQTPITHLPHIRPSINHYTVYLQDINTSSPLRTPFNAKKLCNMNGSLRRRNNRILTYYFRQGVSVDIVVGIYSCPH